MTKEFSSIGLGITFSNTHLNYLNSLIGYHNKPISVNSALEKALKKGFSHIRFGSYWREMEKEKGVYDFSVIESLLDQCEKVCQPVIMTVGIKSPRWPEFYWPTYLEEKNFDSSETKRRTLLFIEELIGAIKKYTCITHWQVENEPLDPSGEENIAIPLSFLKKEVELARRLDNRPILLTLWGKDLEARQIYPQLWSLADEVGLDIYYRGSGESYTSSGPNIDDDYLRQFTATAPKPVIITELQAEPWETDMERYLSENPKSISPELLESNLSRAQRLGVNEIILWGYEYWYYRENHGDSRYLDLINRYLKSE